MTFVSGNIERNFSVKDSHFSENIPGVIIKIYCVKLLFRNLFVLVKTNNKVWKINEQESEFNLGEMSGVY